MDAEPRELSNTHQPAQFGTASKIKKVIVTKVHLILLHNPKVRQKWWISKASKSIADFVVLLHNVEDNTTYHRTLVFFFSCTQRWIIQMDPIYHILVFVWLLSLLCSNNGEKCHTSNITGNKGRREEAGVILTGSCHQVANTWQRRGVPFDIYIICAGLYA